MSASGSSLLLPEPLSEAGYVKPSDLAANLPGTSFHKTLRQVEMSYRKWQAWLCQLALVANLHCHHHFESLHFWVPRRCCPPPPSPVHPGCLGVLHGWRAGSNVDFRAACFAAAPERPQASFERIALHHRPRLGVLKAPGLHMELGRYA